MAKKTKTSTNYADRFASSKSRLSADSRNASVSKATSSYEKKLNSVNSSLTKAAKKSASNNTSGYADKLASSKSRLSADAKKAASKSNVSKTVSGTTTKVNRPGIRTVTAKGSGSAKKTNIIGATKPKKTIKASGSGSTKKKFY